MRSGSVWSSARRGGGLRALRAAAAVLLVAAAPLAGARSDPKVPDTGSLELEKLMRGMAGSRGVVASFRETKELALLDVPIESRGTLYFVPPDRLARHMSAPTRSELVIDGDRVQFRDESGREGMDLSGSPIARVYLDNFTVLFGGDLPALEARYEVDFQSDEAQWKLRLVPRSKRVKRFVEHIELRGDPVAMREMVIVERDGDRTTTVFEQVDPDHAFARDELAQLFGEAARPGDPR